MADVESTLKVTEEVRKPREPKDEAHFVAAILDRKISYQTGMFFRSTAVGPENSCCLGKLVMMESLDGRKLDYMVPSRTDV